MDTCIFLYTHVIDKDLVKQTNEDIEARLNTHTHTHIYIYIYICICRYRYGNRDNFRCRDRDTVDREMKHKYRCIYRYRGICIRKTIQP